jgi:hypothetical protein
VSSLDKEAVKYIEDLARVIVERIQIRGFKEPDAIAQYDYLRDVEERVEQVFLHGWRRGVSAERRRRK